MNDKYHQFLFSSVFTQLILGFWEGFNINFGALRLASPQKLVPSS